MTFSSPHPNADPAAAGLVETLRPKWGWFVGLGALAALLGVAALSLTVSATIASVLTIGIFMLLIGATEIVIGFQARTWGRVLYWEIAGFLYLVAGMFAISDPVPASFVITLMLGAGLLATGIVRLVLGVKMHSSLMRPPLIVAGAVTALLGLVIVLGWPGNSLVVLGTLLGIDLVFSGVSWMFFGLRLRPSV